jgi:hypothetical protein
MASSPRRELAANGPAAVDFLPHIIAIAHPLRDNAGVLETRLHTRSAVMSTSRNPFAVVAVTTVLIFSVASTTCAQQIVTGDVPVVADIFYQQYVNFNVVSTIMETNVPATLSFTVGFIPQMGSVLVMDLESNIPPPYVLRNGTEITSRLLVVSGVADGRILEKKPGSYFRPVP